MSCVAAGEAGRSEKAIKKRTSNIERPTSNVEWKVKGKRQKVV